MSLSPKANLLLRYLRQQLIGNRPMPSYEIIAAAIGLKSKSNISRYLDELKNAGVIDYEPGKPRTIVLLETSRNFVSIPIGGSISAGHPIPPASELNSYNLGEVEYLTFSRDMLPKSKFGPLVALRVDGDSMIDANIQHGDWVILTTEFDKRIGDMLAFWLKDDSSLTLKRYFEEGDIIILQPENPNYAPKRKPRELVEAQGKVIMVYRTFDA